ncbi:MAG: 4Fe-4S binding protein [Peptococcaceae bacterium]|nr:4Fe-4S binding protein [Peptococcaceae bacterium]
MVRIYFHEERCKGCGLCVKFCPKEIIVMAEHINAMGFHPATVTDPSSCKGCAVCAWMCPDVAIELERDEVHG